MFGIVVLIIFWLVDATSLDEHTGEETPVADRPSQYLRERCPLCFGGENWQKPDQMYVS